MSTEFRFALDGRPVTWQRTTPDRRTGRHHVTEAAQREAKRRLYLAARAARPGIWPLDCEYHVEVMGYWPDRRFGDVDRLVSLVMDALEGVAYRTDRQVAHQAGGRRLDRERPRTEVIVRVL